MSLSSRDVLLMVRVRDYASREVRNIGGAFGLLGRAIQKVDSQLKNNLNDSLAKQNRAIQHSKDSLAKFNKVMDTRISQSLDREAAALGKNSAAYKTHSNNLADNTRLTNLAKDSHLQFARSIENEVTNAKRAHTAATEANNAVTRKDIANNRSLHSALLQRNKDIRANQTAMHAGKLGQEEAVEVAKKYTNQLRRLSTGEEKYTRGMSERAAAQVRANSASHQAFLYGQRKSAALEEGRISQQQYARAVSSLLKVEKARNSQVMGQLNQERDARKETQRSEQRLIDQTKNKRINAAEDTIRANKRATDDRVAHLKTQRQAEVERHAAHQQQVRDRGQLERESINRAKQMYGEQSKTYQQRLAQMGAADRANHEAQAQRAKEQLQIQQRKIAMMHGLGIAALILGAAMTSFGRKGVQALRSLVMEAAEFRHGMALTMTQIQNDTPATIEGLTRVAYTVGTEIPAAMDTMGSTMFFIFSSLRASVPEAQQLLRGFAKEAVAGNTNIEAAARSTIAILNGMNLEFKDLNRVQDFQFQTVRRGVITYEQLSQNIGKLIPSLARAGQEIETGGAMLAFLTRQGLSAEMATTAAARSLEILAHPRVIRRMEDMGLAIRDQHGEFLPLIDILSGMNDQIGHLTAPGRAEAMWDIFGGAGYRIQARRFFDTVFTNFERFTWHIDQQKNNAGAMKRAYAIMFAEPVNQIQLFRNQLQVLRMEFGERLMPVLNQLIETGKNVIVWFRNLDDSTKDGIIRFMAFGSAAMVVTGILLALGGMFTLVLGMVRTFTQTMPIAVGIVTGAPAVIMLLVSALFWLALNWDKVSGAVRKAIDWLKTAEGTAFAMISTIGLLAYSIAALGGVTGIVKGISAAFLLAKGSVKKFTAALKALFIKGGPVGWAILLVGALVTAFVALRTAARRSKAAVQEYADAQYEVGMAIDESLDNFDNFQKAMGDSRREIARNRIANEDLVGSIHAVGFSEREFLDIISGSAKHQIQVRNRLDRRLDASRHLRTQAAADERKAIQSVIRELNHSITASKLVEEQIKSELRARGGLSEVIADYMDIVDDNNDSSRVQAHRMREVIRQALLLQAAMGNVDEELLNAAMSANMLTEEQEDLILNMNHLSEAAQQFGNVTGNLTSITTAWTDALSKANEGLEEPLDSLRDHDDALQLWMTSMEEGRDTTRSMFTDMTTIIGKNSELMNDDISTVIGAVLAMGDAAPDAMAVMATADPEEFLKILRHIRLQTALTSDEVAAHLDEMIGSLQNLIGNYSEETVASWDDILEALVLVTYKHSDLVEGRIEGMVQGIADYIEAGGQLSVDEMDRIMSLYVLIAEKYGNMTSDEIFDMMQLMHTYINNGGDILSEDFEAHMNALSAIARMGGSATAVELAEALGVSVTRAKEIGREVGIEFDGSILDNMDPKHVAGTYALMFRRQSNDLNAAGRHVGSGIGRATTNGARDGFNGASVGRVWGTEIRSQLTTLRTNAYTGGESIARNLGFGLSSVSLQLPNIRMPSNTAAVRNALRDLGPGRNSGGFIPGRGPDRDSVLTPTTPGEFVLRRKAADSLSPEFLHALNRYGADVFSGVGVGAPQSSSAPQTAPQSGSAGSTYNYMPNAQVIVQEPQDIEIELAKFENWLRSEQP